MPWTRGRIMAVVAVAVVLSGAGGFAVNRVLNPQNSVIVATVTFNTYFGATFAGFVGNTLVANGEKIGVESTPGIVQQAGGLMEIKSYHWTCEYGFVIQVEEINQGLLRVEVSLDARPWGWAAMQHPGNLTIAVVC